jgi:hypothetical protein
VNNRVVLAGLSETGKTSYLALLYHAIVQERADGLRLGRFDDDRDHITEISDLLLSSKVADHTTVDDEQEITLSLVYKDFDFVLNIPDLSGETWEHALVDRRWSSAFVADISDGTGFMLFVHCTDINDGLSIVDAEQAAAAIIGEDDAPNDEARDESEKEQGQPRRAGVVDPDDAEASGREGGNGDYAPDDDLEKRYKQLTQVSLIELTQFFAAASPRPIRLSLVISAWDLETKVLTPQQWLCKNAPMLAQFLEVNGDEVEATVWGVSAQGADLSDDRIREAYKDKDPIDRARIHAADGLEVGVAAPLLWVLRLDQ